MSSIRNRIVDHVKIRAGDLVPHELNFRTHPEGQKKALQALYTSNDNDADHLWFSYENASFINTIRAFGMRSTRFTTSAYWGNIDTTAKNLANLMNYVLTSTPAGIRNYLVYRLQHLTDAPEMHIRALLRERRPQRGIDGGKEST